MNAQPPALPHDLRHTCAACGGSFAANEVLELDGRWICATCKPRFFQSLAESGRIGGPVVAREGKTLVMSRDAQLPDRCVKCNAADGIVRLKRNLYWHHPLIYLCLLANILIYAIVATCVRKRATIEVGLCPRHLKRRRAGIAIGWGSFGLFVASLFALGLQHGGWIALAGFVIFLVGVVAGVVMSTPVSPKRIDEENIWLKGVHPAYLAGLPEWRA